MALLGYHKAEFTGTKREKAFDENCCGADHGGFEMKNQIVEDLRKQGFAVEDLGTNSADSVDYPDFAEKATAKVLAGQADLGILVCGTGIGISIAANRHKGIRAAILYDDYVAKVAREHNNANVLCFGGRTMTTEDVLRRIGIFLKAAYEGGRHDRRLCKLDLD